MRMTIQAGWNASARITAAADTAVLIRNTDSRHHLYWNKTDDDNPPAYLPGLSPIVPQFSPFDPQASQYGLTLRAGERLWLAGVDGPFDVTIVTGGA